MGGGTRGRPRSVRGGDLRLPDLLTRFDRLERRLVRAHALAVALDYDGTLAPIVNPPRRSRLAPATREAIARLARSPHVRVAVLSGRRRADLVRLVRVRGVALFGASGAEVPHAFASAAPKRARFARRHADLCASLEAWCAAHRPAWLEDKGPIVEVHCGALRGAPRARFLAGVRRRLRPRARVLSITRLARGFELGERRRPDKGTALARWLARGPRGALLLYAGDDANDRPALAATRRRRGVAIAVGRARAIADATLAGPRDVRAFLERLAGAWARAHSARQSARRARDRESTPAPGRRRTSRVR